MTAPDAPGFQVNILAMFVGKIAFEHTGDPLRTTATEQPDSQTDLSIGVVMGEGNTAAVQLTVECSDPQSPYQYSVSYNIVLRWEGDSPENIRQRLAVTGSNILFPFLRELIVNLSSRGKSGPTTLGPVNFNQIVLADDGLANAGDDASAE